jgi:hypothetical protein
MDNIFVERLWRSLKYEEVYLKDYASVVEARAGIAGYFQFYNRQRLHQSLDYHTPGPAPDLAGFQALFLRFRIGDGEPEAYEAACWYR